MRWKHKDSIDPQPAATRICKGFLFFPKRINDETRWLEFAKWKEYYTAWNGGEWLPEKWLRLDE